MTVETTGKRVHYETLGPFPLDLGRDRSPVGALEEFWESRNHDCPNGLQNAVGVYVWTHLGDSGKRVPWNVGLTNRQGFKGRFNQKYKTFSELQKDGQAREVEVYLLALKQPSGRGFRAPTISKQISSNVWLEKELIKAALLINGDLRNKTNAKKAKVLVVDGYLNDGGKTRNASAKSFAKLFAAGN